MAERSPRFRGPVLALIALGRAVVGFGSTKVFVREKTRSHAAKPQDAEAATSLHWIARQVCLRHPIYRMLYPSTRLETLTYEPVRCPRAAVGTPEPNASYTAVVKVYTWFVIPARTLHVSCGGVEVACR